MPPRAFELQKLLGTPVKFGGFEDPKTTLQEALEQLAKRYGVEFDVNEKAFKYDQVNDVTVNEGNSGTVDATLTVRLSAPSTLPVSVSFTTSNRTAAAGLDYLAASGLIELLERYWDSMDPNDIERARSVSHTLEAIGPDAAPAVPALLKCLVLHQS